MPYFAPYIDETGFHMPTYTDIINNFTDQAKLIFGQDIYLGIDSQDYQYMSVIASAIYDSFLTAQMVFNNRGPSTAIGSGLDIITKINGIKRKAATYSTCDVSITGDPNTVINNGIVADVNGIQWNLPASVIIDADEEVTVLATCQIPGPISAQPGDINTIVTPMAGWTGVTNEVAAAIGSNIETDSQFRARQALSTEQPSQSVFEGLKGAISQVLNVTRFELYENDTSDVNSMGHPANSITAVVEGGADADIANAIYLRKTPGCYTNGNVSVDVRDLYGNENTIRFYRPIYKDVDIVINVKAFSGYTTDFTDSIKQGIANYCDSLGIGTALSISALWGIGLSSNIDMTHPNYSITGVTAAVHGGVQGTSDIIQLFNEVVRGNTDYITVNII